MAQNNDKNKKNKAIQVLSAVLVAAGIGCVGYYLYTLLFPPAPPPPAPVVSVSEPVSPPPSSSEESVSSGEEDPTIHYPEGKLFITQERADYDGSMTLTLPRLGIENMPVLGDVSEESLAKGIGLYDYSQMPGTGNRNVSIAGHRDIKGCEFYYIDTVTEGDLISVRYQGKEYIYRFRDSAVVEENDWSPIHIQGFSCLTLTSCTPIGVASHRIIIRAELEEIVDLTTGESRKIPSIG